MQNRLKTLIFSVSALVGLMVAVPVMAQTYNQSYYYPQQYSTQYTTPYSGYGSSCPAISYNLTLGTSDRTTAGQVSQLQNFLRSRYGDARVTGGYYGQLTSYYVSRFQQEQGVYPATGGVGQLTRAAIQRVCGGGYYPNPNPYNPRTTTFRLERTFTLDVGQTGELRNEELTLKLDQVITSSYGYGYYNNQEPQAARITLVEGCRAGTYCFYAPSRTFTLEEDDTVTFEDYEIELVKLERNEATFRVTEDDDNDNNDDDATIEVTRPSGNQTVEQGDELDIAWESTDEPNNITVVIELYDEDDDRVGTIAITDDEDGDYEWDVPEGGDVCTQQFPNGLCGYDLEGEFYIKVSLVRGTSVSGEVLDTDKSATFEIED